MQDSVDSGQPGHGGMVIQLSRKRRTGLKTAARTRLEPLELLIQPSYRLNVQRLKWQSWLKAWPASQAANQMKNSL